MICETLAGLKAGIDADLDVSGAVYRISAPFPTYVELALPGIHLLQLLLHRRPFAPVVLTRENIQTARPGAR